MKKVRWVGSALDDLKRLPEPVQDTTGYILDRVQRGQNHPRLKPLKGLSGVQEIRVDYDKDTFRTVYVANFEDYVYVLHVFKKKSKQGVATPKPEMDTVRERLKRAREDANRESKR